MIQYSLTGSKRVETVVPFQMTNGLVLIEHQGLIYYKQKKKDDFYKKPILRQILALILKIYPESMSKNILASTVWGEEYSPLIHDSRIYTSIQRIRDLLSSTAIENWNNGYRWSSREDFFYYVRDELQNVGQHKLKYLIIETLHKCKKNGKGSIGRKELVESLGSSDATIKRFLYELMSEGKIRRSGAGSSVYYEII